MFADAFHEMEESLADARIAAAEADIKAGRVTRGTADELIADTFRLFSTRWRTILTTQIFASTPYRENTSESTPNCRTDRRAILSLIVANGGLPWAIYTRKEGKTRESTKKPQRALHP